jgi:hypothetical protein
MLGRKTWQDVVECCIEKIMEHSMVAKPIQEANNWCKGCTEQRKYGSPPRLKMPADGHAEAVCDANYVLNRCKVSESGCWEWQLSTSKFGHGRVRVRSQLVLPHRVVAFATGLVSSVSDVGQSACVLHRCDNPKCCNPDHLFAGSMSDNTKDAVAKGRHKIFGR